MFLRLFQIGALLFAAFLAVLPATASTITSSNGLDSIGFASSSSFNSLEWSGSPPSWYNSVTSEAGANGWSMSSSITSVNIGSILFGVSGANGTNPGSIEGFGATPMTITPPGGYSTFTGLVFELTTGGTITIQLTLADGSTVSETSSPGTDGWVSFLSPIQITSIQLSGNGNSFSIQDIERGTAIAADLPAQPADSGGSSTPESASTWLTGGGLIVFSRFLRRRRNGD
jgi:hypothetical protein